jgi:hypothetical protein
LSTPPRHSGPSWSWRAIAIVVAVVVVAGAAAFLLLKGGGGAGPDGLDTSHLASPLANEPHPVHFSVRATSNVAVVAKKKPDQATIKTATTDLRNTLGNMYTLAFTDPDHWKSGDYDSVFGFFAQGPISKSAQRDVATLTLGSKAGDLYKDVTPKYSSLVVKWLTDKGGQPFTAAATADFSATATKKDGSTALIKSHATYLMQLGEGGWIVVGYKAKRLDGTGGGKTTKSPGGNQ